MKTILLLLLTSISLAATPDLFFLPPAEGASVALSVGVQTEAGTRRLEVRRLAFLNSQSEAEPTTTSCVIYYSAAEGSPSILKIMPDCIAPTVKHGADDIVEIYFIAGAHTHIRQRWSLLPDSAALIDEVEVEWHQNPIHQKKTEPNKALEPMRLAVTHRAFPPFGRARCAPASRMAHLGRWAKT